MNDNQKDTLVSALYSYVCDTVSLYHNGNMQESTADTILEDIRQICFKNEIKDVVTEYYENEAEREIDEQATRAHDAYHGW